MRQTSNGNPLSNFGFDCIRFLCFPCNLYI